MADPVVHITNGIPDSGTGNITTLGAIVALLPTALGAGGGLKVDGSGTALPISGTVAVSSLGGTVTVSGTVTANAGTNLNTSALALEAGGNLAQLVTTLGAVTASPTANTIGDRLKTINTTLGSPFQAGGSIGNTGFTASQSGTWTVQPGNTPNTIPWLATINDGTNSAAVKAASTAAIATDKALVVALSPNINGQKSMANSVPVVLPSDQAAIPVTLSSTTVTGTVAVTESGTWNVGSSSAIAAAVPANAFYQGLIAKTALPAAATDANLVGAMGDKFGRQIVVPQAPRDLIGTAIVTLSASVAETTLIAAAASVFNDLLSLILVNTSVTGVRLDFRDDTGGTIIFSFYLPPTDTRGLTLQVPIPQTAVNKNWTVQSSASVTDIRVFAQYVKNK